MMMDGILRAIIMALLGLCLYMASQLEDREEKATHEPRKTMEERAAFPAANTVEFTTDSGTRCVVYLTSSLLNAGAGLSCDWRDK